MGHACEYGCSWEPEDGEGCLEGKLQVVVSFLTQVLVKKLMTSSRAVCVLHHRATISPTKDM